MIALKNVSVSFGDKQVLTDFSLEIPLSGVTCIAGPSGCGKTTLLRVLAGLQSFSGAVEGLPDGRIAFMFQEDRLLPWLDALANVRAVLPRERARDAQALLFRVGLGDELHKFPSELSGGMRRRVALARALAFGGRLMLLDEPFKGADAKLAARLAALVCESGIPTVVATHSEDDIRNLGGNVIRFSGPPLSRL